jgi:hypothetical protein
MVLRPRVINSHEIRNYFRYPRVGWVVEELGLLEVRFGEYMVERRALSREQLFRALSVQDHQPGLRIGEVVAALGLVPHAEVDRLLAEFHSVAVVEVSPSRE